MLVFSATQQNGSPRTGPLTHQSFIPFNTSRHKRNNTSLFLHKPFLLFFLLFSLVIMRLTAEVITGAPVYMNPIRQREINLRGTTNNTMQSNTKYERDRTARTSMMIGWSRILTVSICIVLSPMRSRIRFQNSSYREFGCYKR